MKYTAITCMLAALLSAFMLLAGCKDFWHPEGGRGGRSPRTDDAIVNDPFIGQWAMNNPQYYIQIYFHGGGWYSGQYINYQTYDHIQFDGNYTISGDTATLRDFYLNPNFGYWENATAYWQGPNMIMLVSNTFGTIYLTR